MRSRGTRRGALGTITFRGLGWQKPGWYFNARSTGWVGPYKSKASAQKAMRAELDVQTRALSGDWGGTRGVSFRVYINGQTPYVMQAGSLSEANTAAEQRARSLGVMGYRVVPA